jgi:hypothetical protein
MKAWWGRQNFKEKYLGAPHKTPMRKHRDDIKPVPGMHYAFRETGIAAFRDQFFGTSSMSVGPYGFAIRSGAAVATFGFGTSIPGEPP